MTDTCVDNSLFYKHLGSKGVQDGERIALLSQSLAAARVPTPVARFDPRTHSLVLPRLRGCEARELIQAANGDDTAIAPIWSLILSSLVKLHALDPAPDALERIDPFANITRRLADDVDDVFRFPVTSVYAALRKDVSDDLSQADLKVVHGDFHVGQVIIDPTKTVSHIVDLDDVALGLPEMDVANFVAHMVTSPKLRLPNRVGDNGGLAGQFADWVNRLSDIYTTLASRELNRHRLMLFGSVALLRRALKVNEHEKNNGQARKILIESNRIYQSESTMRVEMRVGTSRRFQRALTRDMRSS